ncbi:MAG: penicillin-binding protein 2 [Alphaproteobacteria bacterium]
MQPPPSLDLETVQEMPERRRAGEPIKLVGIGEQALRKGRARLALTGVVFGLAFAVLAVRLGDLAWPNGDGEARPGTAAAAISDTLERGDIVDRNGTLVASNLSTVSLYADARLIDDAAAVAAKLVRIMPDLDEAAMRARLTSGRAFVWIKRNLTPAEQFAVNRLGIPGLDFQEAQRRIYPQGPLLAHVLGFTDIDNGGIAGLERSLDTRLRTRRDGPVELSIDLRVQHAVRDVLAASMARYKALGAAGLVLDATTGEVVSMVSLPDFDPNDAGTASDDARFNRITLGVYELGSVFKAFTVAMALDTGTVDMRGGYDATHPIKVARFTIRDDHPKARWLSVPEIFKYSSNIGAAKMAMDVGTPRVRQFLARLGMLTRPDFELPETGAPLAPSPWRDINTMTVAFGHGLAVSPLQLASGMSALVNGGTLARPTLIKQKTQPRADRVISKRTSRAMRGLLRLVVADGTGKQADVPGYLVGGKTGTAEKAKHGGYARKALISSFVAAFPIKQPRYVVYALLDEPRGIEETHGFRSAGWNAAPTAGRIIARIAPLLGVRPEFAPPPESEGRMAVAMQKGTKLASF